MKKSSYDYYINVIKPIEKKYTRVCIIYSIFKIYYFKRKSNYYKMILNLYYKELLNNKDAIKELKDAF